MNRRRFILGLFALSVMACAGLVAFVALPSLRRALAEPIVGRARLHGTMHFMTPLEKVHHWLAPPILRGELRESE